MLPEKRRCRTGVNEIVTGIVAGHVGEPEGSFGIDCHPRRIDTAEGAVAVLHHPINGRFRPTVRWLTPQTERRTFLGRYGRRRLIFE